MNNQTKASKKMGKFAGGEQENGRVWDCGSSLYDSYELDSFQRHLHSAIASRTMSMPHLPDQSSRPPPSKSSKKVPKPRSLHRFLRSIFHFKLRPSSSPELQVQQQRFRKVPETEVQDNHYDFSLARRAASERFTSPPASIGISCP